MQPYHIILIFLASIVLARYHEKTRFDRSVHNTDVRDIEKQWSFTDNITQFIAYKSRKENDCYLENIKQDQNLSHKKRQPKILYASIALTKLEAWQLAGGRIVDFCNGQRIILLQTNKPIPGQTLDPFLNEIPVDENDIFPRRIIDVILTPLKARIKRQIQFEQREMLNENSNKIRLIRQQTNQFRGKFRGQTQSQYLNLGNHEQKEGKAEAEATQLSSRAVVSGNRGMGQAQSMSSSGPGCEDCPGYFGIKKSPDRTLLTGTDRYVQGSAITGTPVITRPGTEVPAGVLYPGDVTPGRQITYPGGVIPGRVDTYSGVPGVSPGIYPGGIQPGTVTPETDKIYPGGVRPGTVTPGTDHGIYLAGVRPGTIMPGSDTRYAGGVRPGTMAPGVGITYPGTVQSGTMASGIGAAYSGDIRPGIIISGVGTTYPGTVQPGTMIPGVSATYPGSIRPGTVIPGIGVTYPGVVQPGRVVPGITTEVGTGIETYPGGIYQPGVHAGQGTHPSDGVVTTSITTGATAVTGVNTYPSGITPGKGLSVTYPGVSETRIYPGAGIYPDYARSKTVSGTRADTYPDGVAPGRTDQGIYPSDRQQTGTSYIGGLPSTLPGQMDTTTGSVGADTQIITYPSGQITEGQAIYPSDTIQSSRIPEGISGAPGTKVMYPIGTYPGSATIPVTYPGSGTYPASSMEQVTSPGVILYPDQAIYPGGVDQVSPYPSGQRPGASTDIFRRPDKPEGFQYPTVTIDGQRTTGETRIDITGQYHGSYPGEINGQKIGIGQYPGKSFTEMGETAGTGEISQGGDPGRPMGVMDNGAESQASSSVQQIESGTQASASAQGKYGSGTAQSQVTGTYSGSGTFSAQAGTSDANKSAQTEISGGKEGATSIAQGIADHGKSQTQVHLDSDSGATSTGAQSSGWNHGTNSQVQASSRGGMADAQANGEGSTSSQAQIGFQPYLKDEHEKVEENVTPFRGSGTASAQSGIHQGQSQSQLHGSFQYGITYTGAAQAGSGSGVALSRKPFNFNITDTVVSKPFKSDPLLKKLANIDSAKLSPPTSQNYENKQDDREKGLQSRLTSKQTVIVNSKNNPSNNKKVRTAEKLQTNDSIYDEYDEYADEEDYSMDSRLTIQEKFSEILPNPDHQKLSKTTQQQNHSQKQTIQIAKGNQYGIQVNQDLNVPQTGDTLQPGESVPGYTIPVGFRGRVISTSGTKTIAQGDGESQSQTVSLIPKDLNNTKSPVTKTRSLQTNHERYASRHISNSKIQNSFVNQNVSSDKHTRPTSAVAMKPSYYTVTNSFAGKINGSNEPKKYEHRYYTKSSTCGYFTFSCNVVYGSNGRTKICKPKLPTYPDGTPMKC
ncbi:mucin-19-like [Cataglyphis hispanica]|uniref:mucin-19-like n=1 Tax=Cataglyphis hispanica TaxID=1086592 RepID=UPI00218056EF|nr:mucin-19-like [Cataglyphis hispanica]